MAMMIEQIHPWLQPAIGQNGSTTTDTVYDSSTEADPEKQNQPKKHPCDAMVEQGDVLENIEISFY